MNPRDRYEELNDAIADSSITEEQRQGSQLALVVLALTFKKLVLRTLDDEVYTLEAFPKRLTKDSESKNISCCSHQVVREIRVFRDESDDKKAPLLFKIKLNTRIQKHKKRRTKGSPVNKFKKNQEIQVE